MIKKKLLLSGIIFLFLFYESHATDIKIGIVLDPPESVVKNTTYDVIIQLLNINVLLAEYFTVSCRITNLNTDEIVYDETDEGFDLAAFSEIDFKFSKPYTPTVQGSYSMYFKVDFSEDIDNSNNEATFTFECVAPPECESSMQWHPASSIKVLRDFEFFPDDEDFHFGGLYMRPGDAIGVSCLADDEDILIESCGCEESSSTKAYGPFKDQLKYEWTIEGDNEVGGTIINAPGKGNSIMYQLPNCIQPGEYRTRIKCTVKNDPELLKAADADLVGYVTVRVIYRNHIKRPLVFGYSEGFDDNSDQDYSTEVDEMVCFPEEPFWETFPEMSNEATIVETNAPDFCPDYISLLSVEKTDTDILKAYCSATDGCGPNDTTMSSTGDPLEFEWTVLSGKGSFPLGNRGPSVVFWKSRSEDANIQCVIRDSRLQGNDNIISVTKMVMKAKAPKAFVTVGSQHCFNNPFTGKRVGQCDVFKEAAQNMRTAYENAGYLVQYSEFTDLDIIKSVLEDPCFQAFCMTGHGAQGLMTYPEPPGGFPGGFDPEAPPAFAAVDMHIINRDKWGCRQSPRIHDLRLLGCETSQDETQWVNNTHNAVFFGFEDEVSFRWLGRMAKAHADGGISVEPPYNRSMP